MANLRARRAASAASAWRVHARRARTRGKTPGEGARAARHVRTDRGASRLAHCASRRRQSASRGGAAQRSGAIIRSGGVAGDHHWRSLGTLDRTVQPRRGAPVARRSGSRSDAVRPRWPREARAGRPVGPRVDASRPCVSSSVATRAARSDARGVARAEPGDRHCRLQAARHASHRARACAARHRHLSEAERAFRFAVRAAERASASAEEVQARLGLVDARLRRGQIAAAANASERVRRLARASRSRHAEAAALLASAEIESRRGRTARAQRLFAEAARKVPSPRTPYGYWFNVAAE
ncbi:MAG: hypothetical protein JWM53_784 [bacterium]|nr:hypothetical protein [bacterium]